LLEASDYFVTLLLASIGDYQEVIRADLLPFGLSGFERKAWQENKAR